jgi:hypothetical protein
VLRHSQSDTQNPNVVDWTDRYRDAYDTQFFSGAIREVALHSRAGHFPEPADQGVPNHSSAMVEYCFEEIQLDLTPGANDRNSAPEHLWNGARWWSDASGSSTARSPAGTSSATRTARCSARVSSS